MEKIFDQIPSKKIVINEIESTIWQFISKVSNIIRQKKSEEIKIELNKDEEKIMQWRYSEKIKQAFQEKWWNTILKTEKRLTWVQWDMYEEKYSTMIISIID